MEPFKKLIHEAHRRSLWQVLGLYLMGSWVALQVVESLTESAGLPDWVSPFALVLLIIGFPVVMATAFVQEGTGGQGKDPAGAGPPSPQSPPPTSPNLSPGTGSLDLARTRRRVGSHVFTWRNAFAGGVLAFALLGVLVAGYFIMRASGLGPVASLAAQGVFDEREPVVLADFANSSSDPTLGDIVTESLRIDLASSQALTLVEPDRVRDALRRMQRDPNLPLTPELAREVAQREGIKAVVEGEVGAAGSGYILLATVRASDSGAPLASFRRTTKDSEGVIEAIDKLSQDIREKAGESLRSIKAEEPLQAVTTASLEALRKYSEALVAEDRGEFDREVALLEEAVALDPAFAMAYRKLAVALQSAGGSREERMEAATRAYELRDRLTERERYLAIAYYHNEVTGDEEAEIRAYEGVLGRHPDDDAALNNLAIVYSNRERWEESVELLERAVSGPGESGAAHTNLVPGLLMLGRMEEARHGLMRYEDRYPGRQVWILYDRWLVESFSGDHEAAHGAADAMVQGAEFGDSWRSFGTSLQALSDAARGRVEEARRHLRQEVDRAREAGRFTDAMGRTLDLARVELYEARRAQAARRLLENALSDGTFDSVPATSRDYRGYGVVLAVTGAAGRAEELLARAEAEIPGEMKGPGYEAARRNVLAMVQAGRGDLEGAARALEELQRSMGYTRSLTYDLGQVYEDMGRPERAIELFEKSLQEPEAPLSHAVRVATTHERLGGLYESAGDAAKASGHYARFAELWADADPELQPRVRHALERARVTGSGSEE